MPAWLCATPGPAARSAGRLLPAQHHASLSQSVLNAHTNPLSYGHAFALLIKKQQLRGGHCQRGLRCPPNPAAETCVQPAMLLPKIASMAVCEGMQGGASQEAYPLTGAVKQVHAVLQRAIRHWMGFWH